MHGNDSKAREATTTVQISTRTRDRLRSLGHPGELYDSIINRAIDGEFTKSKPTRAKDQT